MKDIFKKIQVGMTIVYNNVEYKVVEKGKKYIDTEKDDGGILTIPKWIIDNGFVSIKENDGKGEKT